MSYHPALGRFLETDPEGYVDGPNLYQMERGNPINHLDPLGLWTADRQGGATAPATSEAGDTVEKLANTIGLSENEFQKWLTIDEPLLLQNGQVKYLYELDKSDKLCADQHVRIPNTVMALWVGELDGRGRFLVGWFDDVRYLQHRGFQVVERKHDESPWSATSLNEWAKASTLAKEMHGFFLTGHGAEDGFTDKEKTFGWESYKDLSSNLQYRLALVVLNACDSDWTSSDPHMLRKFPGEMGGRDLVSSHGVFAGEKGTLVPPIDTHHIKDVLKAGQQFTQR